MRHKFAVILKAEIEIGGTYEAHNEAEAREIAEMELRQHGEISNVTVEQNVLLDDDVVEV